MTVILPKHMVFYAAVPKVACSSLKHLFFEIENFREYAPVTINGKVITIHRLYRSLLYCEFPIELNEGYKKFAVVRDPVQRLLSAYGNRVMFHKELSERKAGVHLKNKGVPYNPILQEFVKHLSVYDSVPAIKHHIRPMVDYLGKEIDFFSRIFRFDELQTFSDILSREVGQTLTLRHHQNFGPKFSSKDLSVSERKIVEDYYSSDYQCFSAYLQ